jgi:hypothetical protein
VLTAFLISTNTPRSGFVTYHGPAHASSLQAEPVQRVSPTVITKRSLFLCFSLFLSCDAFYYSLSLFLLLIGSYNNCILVLHYSPVIYFLRRETPAIIFRSVAGDSSAISPPPFRLSPSILNTLACGSFRIRRSHRFIFRFGLNDANCYNALQNSRFTRSVLIWNRFWILDRGK